MDCQRLDAEQLTPLPERLETALVNINASPTINVNLASVVVPQINTGVQVSALGASPQALLQANAVLANLGQANG